MSSVAIRVEHISKQYRLGARQERYRTLRDSIVDLVAAPVRRLHRHSPASSPEQTIWALRDVCFEVQPGEKLGIIGRNGAGKSTLLKVLSRITHPTSGRAEVYGRIGSLLEVGTGFHPELTGRENITLNGAILGMRRAEIQGKFDQIVAFAELERFIDTPVKRYSTGMYLRLAFSVAAYLDTEILVVDEVLAVGDANFQKKCLGKMEEVGAQGRTVLFVSHSMPAVLRLCPRVILLDRGTVLADGSAPDVTAAYLNAGVETSGERRWPDITSAPGDDVVRLRSVRIVGPDGIPTANVDIQQPLAIVVEYWNLKDGVPLIANVHLYNSSGVCLFVSHDNFEPTWGSRSRPIGIYTSVCHVPANFLNGGRISVHAAVSTWNPTVIQAVEYDAVAFDVIDTGGVRGEYVGEWPGAIRPQLEWTTSFEPAASGAKFAETPF